MNKIKKIATIWWIIGTLLMWYKLNQKITQNEIQNNINISEFDKFDKKIKQIVFAIHKYNASKKNKKQISNQEYFTHEWTDINLEWWDMTLDQLLDELYNELESSKYIINISTMLNDKQKEDLIKEINEAKKLI